MTIAFAHDAHVASGKDESANEVLGHTALHEGIVQSVGDVEGQVQIDDEERTHLATLHNQRDGSQFALQAADQNAPVDAAHGKLVEQFVAASVTGALPGDAEHHTIVQSQSLATFEGLKRKRPCVAEVGGVVATSKQTTVEDEGTDRHGACLLTCIRKASLPLGWIPHGGHLQP